jgi:hypothetical protein
MISIRWIGLSRRENIFEEILRKNTTHKTLFGAERENKSREKLNIDFKNKFELTFILYTRYWNGIQLHFTGLNANHSPSPLEERDTLFL